MDGIKRDKLEYKIISVIAQPAPSVNMFSAKYFILLLSIASFSKISVLLISP